MNSELFLKDGTTVILPVPRLRVPIWILKKVLGIRDTRSRANANIIYSVASYKNHEVTTMVAVEKLGSQVLTRPGTGYIDPEATYSIRAI